MCAQRHLLSVLLLCGSVTFLEIICVFALFYRLYLRVLVSSCLNVTAAVNIDSGVGVDTRKSQWNNPTHAAVPSHVVCSAVYAGIDCSWSASSSQTLPAAGISHQYII